MTPFVYYLFKLQIKWYFVCLHNMLCAHININSYNTTNTIKTTTDTDATTTDTDAGADARAETIDARRDEEDTSRVL